MSFINDVLALLDADSIKDWENRCHSLAANLGYEYFLYASLPNLDIHQVGIFHGNYPELWQTRYKENHYRYIDPVVAHAFKSTIPLIWDYTLFVTPEQQAFYRDARKFGITNGVCSSLNGLHGNKFIMLSLASSNEKIRPTYIKDKILQQTHLMAIYAHEAVIRLVDSLDGTATEHPRLCLTVREKECLKWLVVGKTNCEIARMLTCSERTVKYHVQNICRKFGVTNRHHATIQAMVLGIVTI